MIIRPFKVFPGASLVAQTVKNPPTMQEICVQSLGWEDLLEKGMATHTDLWFGEFHGLYSSWGHQESNKTERLSFSSFPGLQGWEKYGTTKKYRKI